VGPKSVKERLSALSWKVSLEAKGTSAGGSGGGSAVQWDKGGGADWGGCPVGVV